MLDCPCCGRRRGRAALRFALLSLPALFWAVVFLSLAGGGEPERLSLIADWALRVTETW